MMTLFRQAVDTTFPQLAGDLRDEIYQKVSIHMMEYLKEQVYKKEPERLAELNREIQMVKDTAEKSKIYGENIIKKFLTLPKDEQNAISARLMTELTGIMHKIYKSI